MMVVGCNNDTTDGSSSEDTTQGSGGDSEITDGSSSEGTTQGSGGDSEITGGSSSGGTTQGSGGDSERTNMLCRLWGYGYGDDTFGLLISKEGTYSALQKSGSVVVGNWKWENSEEKTFYFSFSNWVRYGINDIVELTSTRLVFDSYAEPGEYNTYDPHGRTDGVRVILYAR